MEDTSMSQTTSLFKTTLLMTLIHITNTATSGNILGGKPSTDSQGNDEDASTCMFTDAQPTPYWQVDLQGSYDVHNITLRTCWGSWGWKTRSVQIWTYFSNPDQCPGAVGFLYGTTPAGTGESQTHVFHATPTYPVRYIRLVATTQPDLGVKEALAMGTPTTGALVPLCSDRRIIAGILLSAINNKEASLTWMILVLSPRENLFLQCGFSGCRSFSSAIGMSTRLDKYNILQLHCGKVDEGGSVSLLGGEVADNLVEIREYTGISRFSATPGKKVQTALASKTTQSATDCAVRCHMTQTCLAFSFSPSLTEDNCFLAHCPSTTDEIGWTAWIVNPVSNT